MSNPYLLPGVNPFLISVPVVTRVTAVRIVGTKEVETPLKDTVRIWGRVGSAQRAGNTEHLNPDKNRVYPTTYDYMHQTPFDPTKH
ncbi:hypothetical protein [Ralstonia phage RSP15]|uniref:hypothetical protein n=1 Tax=Ralstonia phage RSP15 TaxID=1785960 RepID=UPI00074D426A|nr:hypothetical protein BH754_gp001 [Ralstonia phage RSP15]BAU39959.1 hypothetical protein [Ralstonia phage RSP15]